jgi:hypothetical protein
MDHMEAGNIDFIAQLEMALAFGMSDIALRLLSSSRDAIQLAFQFLKREYRPALATEVSQTLFYLAARQRDPAVPDALSACAIPFGVEERSTRDILLTAITFGHVSTLEALLHNGLAAGNLSQNVDDASAGYQQHYKRFSILQGAIYYNSERSVTILLSLAEQSQTLTGSSSDALITALWYERTWAIGMLLEAGANPVHTLPHHCGCLEHKWHKCKASEAHDFRIDLTSTSSSKAIRQPSCPKMREAKEDDGSDGESISDLGYESTPAGSGESEIASDAASTDSASDEGFPGSRRRPDEYRDFIPRKRKWPSGLPIMPILLACEGYTKAATTRNSKTRYLKIIAEMSRYGADLKTVVMEHPSAESILSPEIWRTWEAHYAPKKDDFGKPK